MENQNTDLPFLSSSFPDDSLSLSSACFSEADIFNSKFVIGSSGLENFEVILSSIDQSISLYLVLTTLKIFHESLNIC